MPSSAHGQHRPRRRPRSSGDDDVPAVGGVLDGVADQVGDDVLELVGVAPSTTAGPPGRSPVTRDAAALGRTGTLSSTMSATIAREVDRRRATSELAVGGAVQHQQLLDDPRQPDAAALDRGDRRAGPVARGPGRRPGARGSPTMLVSGVRSSWETVATRWLLYVRELLELLDQLVLALEVARVGERPAEVAADVERDLRPRPRSTRRRPRPRVRPDPAEALRARRRAVRRAATRRRCQELQHGTARSARRAAPGGGRSGAKTPTVWRSHARRGVRARAGRPNGGGGRVRVDVSGPVAARCRRGGSTATAARKPVDDRGAALGSAPRRPTSSRWPGGRCRRRRWRAGSARRAARGSRMARDRAAGLARRTSRAGLARLRRSGPAPSRGQLDAEHADAARRRSSCDRRDQHVLRVPGAGGTLSRGASEDQPQLVDVEDHAGRAGRTSARPSRRPTSSCVEQRRRPGAGCRAGPRGRRRDRPRRGACR